MCAIMFHFEARTLIPSYKRAFEFIDVKNDLRFHNVRAVRVTTSSYVASCTLHCFLAVYI